MSNKLQKSGCLFVCCIANAFFMAHSRADTLLGWINAGNVSAYTTNQGKFELSLAGLAVNDSLDFLNIRDDLIANNQRLAGKSGDLDGFKFEMSYGPPVELQ
ncbi:MAG: hypothetical protein OXU66_15125, partial [Gammaproteobacteria bacterium]|nr:hypothetical protein [Gammaproteobacteria bacterium]